MRVRGALLAVLSAFALAPVLCMPKAFGQAEIQEQQSGSEQVSPQAFAMSSYQGLTVRDLHVAHVPDSEQDRLLKLVPQQKGQPLQRELVRRSIEALYATGRFSDIEVEVERVPDGQVSILFVTAPNYFIGPVTVDGAPNRPNSNEVVNASKLQLGELFTQDKLDRALDNIQQLFQENGFYRSHVSVEQTRHPETQQIDFRFNITPGPQARVGHLSIQGTPGYSQGQIQDIAKLHPGDLVSVQRVSNALTRLRKKYQKQNRLLAQVSISARTYQPKTNTVDFSFDIDPGPKVDIEVEGEGVSRSALKKNVPVYEENALDDDLLNEGRRNLLNYLQSRGFFEATVGLKKHADPDANQMRVFYIVNRGPRHKLVKVSIDGSMVDNLGFPAENLLSRMQVQPAGRLFSRGRYSQKLLNNDIRDFENLYRANGFAQVKISSNVEDNYRGKQDEIAVSIHIEPGPLTTVNTLGLAGNSNVPEARLQPLLNISVGEPFSEARVAEDRDTILNYYFNHGFPNASFEASARPSAGHPHRMDVTYTIKEGQQFFVGRVLVSGLEHTHPVVVQRKLAVQPGEPISQVDMLASQQQLYDLGIFSQVDTAVQNPDGDDRKKNILVNVQEAKRYTFNYGLGLEFQTGTPAGINQPQGETGVSPRVSFGVTRLNFRGLNHTLTFQSHVGRLQQRGLLSYQIPWGWFGSNDWRLSFTTFFDHTLDVSTFTSQRLEGSVQAQQTISKASTMDYRFTYRLVKATDVVVASDQIPLLSRPVRVGIPGFTYIRDKRDNPLETTRGNYTTIDAGIASSYFGSEADFGRIFIQNSTYQPFGKNRPADKKFVFARSTRIGVEAPFGNTLILNPGESCPASGSPSPVPPNPNSPAPCSVPVIPLPELFFSGGGNSHRGFGLNQAGPRDPISGFPLGGGGLFLNNLELRFPPVNLPFFQDNISFAIFHDAGNVFTHGIDIINSLLHWTQRNPQFCEKAATANQCNYNYISQAVGVGLRYKTPIGPVRFDFGYNLNPPRFPSTQTIKDPVTGVSTSIFVPQQVSHFNVFFSIGQTF